MRTTHKIKGLYALCDNSFSLQYSHIELARLLLQGGAPILQLRMKGEKDKGRIRAITEEILEEKKNFNFIFILNDFIEVAAQLKVDGLHIGREDGVIQKARDQIGPDKIIGYSSHSLTEALEAQHLGADYVALGAIYPTKTKGPEHPIQGLEILQKAVEQVQIPLVAIGGIQQNNIIDVLKTGVSCIAMITALTQAQDVTLATRNFVNTIDSFHEEKK
ncbi:MAG: thiamine phosphate synthase [Deltaproteobacteria bacterium]|nr:thiamine phosphate synthase [Deltaproteobacteria bacterium]